MEGASTVPQGCKTARPFDGLSVVTGCAPVIPTPGSRIAGQPEHAAQAGVDPLAGLLSDLDFQ